MTTMNSHEPTPSEMVVVLGEPLNGPYRMLRDQYGHSGLSSITGVATISMGAL